MQTLRNVRLIWPLAGALALLSAWAGKDSVAAAPSALSIHRIYAPTITTEPPRTVTPAATARAGPAVKRRWEPCPELDLDGDGTPERWEVRPDSCGTGGCVYAIYIKDRYAGEIAGHCPFQIEPRTDGKPADVIATWRLGFYEVTTRYRFARGRYRKLH
jgi:hypothetical protein